MHSTISRHARSRVSSLIPIFLTVLTLVAATGCGMHREGVSDRDGTTAVTRDKSEQNNYGSSAGTTDQQADDNKVDLMKYKKSF